MSPCWPTFTPKSPQGVGRVPHPGDSRSKEEFALLLRTASGGVAGVIGSSCSSAPPLVAGAVTALVSSLLP